MRSGILPEPFSALRLRWHERVRPMLDELDLPVGDADVPADGRTRRTEDFAWLHGEFTMVAASEPGATW